MAQTWKEGIFMGDSILDRLNRYSTEFSTEKGVLLSMPQYIMTMDDYTLQVSHGPDFRFLVSVDGPNKEKTAEILNEFLTAAALQAGPDISDRIKVPDEWD